MGMVERSAASDGDMSSSVSSQRSQTQSPVRWGCKVSESADGSMCGSKESFVPGTPENDLKR